MSEEVVGDGAEEVDFAVAAGEEELEGFGGEQLDGGLGEIEALELGEVVGGDDVAAVEAEVAGGDEEAGAEVAEGVEVLVYGEGLEELAVGPQHFGVKAVVGVDAGDGGEVGVVFGMEMEQRHHGGGVGEVEVDVVFVLDEHGCLLGREIGGTHRDRRDTDSNETRGY